MVLLSGCEKLLGYFLGMALSLSLMGSAYAVSFSSPWAKISLVSPGPAKVIGTVSNGCLGGAEALPEIGKGFVSIRRHRNRYYGHPETLKVIRHLGLTLSKQTDQLMMVGDISQPRGGRMPNMHRSHQNGLDADIWFLLAPSAKHAQKSTPEKNDPPSMLGPDRKTVNKHWGKYQHLLLKTAAQNPKVDRIFVNPGIKLALCTTEKGDRRWLGKLRPWWGHDAHFHVRLKCPKGSPNCKPQTAIPVGDGCGEALSSWFKPRYKKVAKKKTLKQKPLKEKQKPKKVAKKKAKPKKPTMPTECKPLLAKT